MAGVGEPAQKETGKPEGFPRHRRSLRDEGKHTREKSRIARPVRLLLVESPNPVPSLSGTAPSIDQRGARRQALCAGALSAGMAGAALSWIKDAKSFADWPGAIRIVFCAVSLRCDTLRNPVGPPGRAWRDLQFVALSRRAPGVLAYGEGRFSRCATPSAAPVVLHLVKPADCGACQRQLAGVAGDVLKTEPIAPRTGASWRKAAPEFSGAAFYTVNGACQP